MATLKDKILNNDEKKGLFRNFKLMDSSIDDSSLLQKLKGHTIRNNNNNNNKDLSKSNGNSLNTSSNKAPKVNTNATKENDSAFAEIRNPFVSNSFDNSYAKYGIIGLALFIFIALLAFFGGPLIKTAYNNIIDTLNIFKPPPKKKSNQNKPAVESIKTLIDKKAKKKKEAFENNNVEPMKEGILSNNKYCYVGEYKNVRTCAPINASDSCMSGDIFPSQKICINPSLR